MRAFNITIFILIISIYSNAFSKEELLIGVDEFPPYTSTEFRDNGFLCKLILESFAMAGIPVRYTFRPAKRALIEAQRGDLGGVVGSYEATEFLKDFYISDSLVIDTISFFYLISSEFEWSTFDDLKGIQIGATIGYDYGKEFQQAEKANVIKVYRATRNIQSLKMLLIERIKVFPMSTLPGYVSLYKNFKEKDINRITNHPKPVHSTHLYLFLSKKNQKNKKRIRSFNSSLKKLKDSGKYDQYFDETLEYFRKTYVSKR